MSQYLRVTMPNGMKFDVPTGLIAANRAEYYAKADSGAVSGPEYDKEYAAEYEYALNDESELKDWAANNMDWSDVEHHARFVWPQPEEIDWQDGWVNGDKEFVEHKRIG
ncbi:hypothetical protein D3C81_173750 [compost metagenome]